MSFLVPVLTLVSTFYFVRSSDLVVKQLSLYVTAFMLLVVLSESIFGASFSGKSEIYDNGLYIVATAIWIFYIPFLFFIGLKKVDTNEEISSFSKVNIINEGLLLLFIAPFISFLVYYGYSTGYRLDGQFMDYAGQRSIIVDYAFVYFISMLALFPKYRLLLFIGLIAFFLHFIAAERMRAFVYIMAISIHFYRLDQRPNISSLFLLFGFGIATLVGLIRAGDAAVSDFNVSHFGSVTVSSFYLLDFSEMLNNIEKLKYFIGMQAANIIPSSLIPDEYNIRAEIFNYADIPGGGWLPIFIYILGSYQLVFCYGFIIAFVYKKISIMNSRYYYAPTYGLALTFIATAPRWFMYTPYQLIKMPFYAFIFTLFLGFLLRNINNGRAS